MQNGVIFGIFLTILAKQKVTRSYLADKFEISLRTVSRYCDILCEAGIPLISLDGINGGITLPDDYRLDKLWLTQIERDRLIKILGATASGFDDKLNNTIIDKLSIISHAEESENFTLKTDTLIIDDASWNRPEFLRSKISAINKAIEGDKCISFSYIDRHEFSSARKFAPYSLVLKESVWYTYGWCYCRKDFRLFRLSRIKDIVLSQESFTRVASDVYSKLNFSSFNAEETTFKIGFSSPILPEIEDWLGGDAIAEENNNYIATSTAPSSFLVRKLLSFGSSVKVLSPDSLISELKEECLNISKKY